MTATDPTANGAAPSPPLDHAIDLHVRLTRDQAETVCEALIKGTRDMPLARSAMTRTTVAALRSALRPPPADQSAADPKPSEPGPGSTLREHDRRQIREHWHRGMGFDRLARAYETTRAEIAAICRPARAPAVHAAALSARNP